MWRIVLMTDHVGITRNILGQRTGETQFVIIISNGILFPHLLLLFFCWAPEREESLWCYCIIMLTSNAGTFTTVLIRGGCLFMHLYLLSSALDLLSLLECRPLNTLFDRDLRPLSFCLLLLECLLVLSLDFDLEWPRSLLRDPPRLLSGEWL